MPNAFKLPYPIDGKNVFNNINLLLEHLVEALPKRVLGKYSG